MTRNGGTDCPSPGIHHTPHFHSTPSQRKLRRFNCFIFFLRFAAFSFSLSAALFIIATTNSDSPHWYHFSAFRFVVAANGIVALYSFFEIAASAWEISRGSTVFPEFCQVWFDFAHDQVFAYMLLSAESAGTEMAKQLRDVGRCNGFCVHSEIAVGLGFAGFLFLMVSTLMSGFRVACFLINAYRFHV